MGNVITLLNDEADSIYDQIVKEYLENRILILNQEVNDDIIELYIAQILKWNIEDKDIAVDKRTPIKILINSPGGDMIVAWGLIDAIIQSKTKIVSIGIGLVASAAFHIFISCKERIAFENTVLLMHDGEVEIQNSTSKAKDAMRFFDNLDLRTKNHVLSRTKMDEKYYDDHYDQELYLYADEAKELGCVDKIVGHDIDMDLIFD